MQISKINSYHFSNSSMIARKNNPNFNGVLVYQGREEASWSNRGGMGESWYDRYTYVPTVKETSEETMREVDRLGRKVALKLPDNERFCSYCVLVDINTSDGQFSQKYFDKPVKR